MNGTALDDIFRGARGDDVLNGGDGDDMFLWNDGDGSDAIDGGDGFDTARFNLHNGNGVNTVLSDFGGNAAQLSGDGQSPFTATMGNVERVVISGQDGDDSVLITATTASGLLGVNFAGGRSQDSADASGSDLKLVANGGEGDDVLIGGTTNDILRGDEAQDTLIGNEGDDELFGGDGTDVLVGGAGEDRLFGGEGQDELNGGADDDLLLGEDGDDLLIGGAGRDVLIGGAHQDTLLGGAGNDRLLGQAGDDLMTGGAGADVFVFTVDSGHDRITNFTDGSDILRFNGLGIGFADLTFQDVGADLKIFIPSVNGDDVTLLGSAGLVLDGSDFLFA